MIASSPPFGEAVSDPAGDYLAFVVAVLARDTEVADERGAPARFEDHAVEAFDMAVGLWAAGADEGVRAFFWPGSS